MHESFLTRLKSGDLAVEAAAFLTRRRYWRVEAFNCQLGRRRLFREIMAAHPFSAIVETGTFLGQTTRYFACTTGLPVFTVEIAKKRYAAAAKKFEKDPNIKVLHGSSETVLWGGFIDGSIPSRDAFIYLDAHWNDYLPLRDELGIVLKYCRDAVVMIDDFEVPDDSGYGYDDYGPDGALRPAYLAPFADSPFRVFYPTLPSSRETGRRRGCIVLAQGGAMAAKLAGVRGLRPAGTVAEIL